MRHNKFMGWERFLGIVEQVQKYSPWLSRQIAKRASEWPFWYSGLQIKEWEDRRVWVRLPHSFRNTVEGEISFGHLALGAELCLRLVFLRLRQEFPLRLRLTGAQTELHHAVDQTVDFKFSLSFEEWENLRLELARHQEGQAELVVTAALADGRSAGQFVFQAAFQLEKFLPA